MSSKEVVVEVALDFLKAVTKAAEAKLGRHPEYLQRSEWMVHTGPTSSSSKLFERKALNQRVVSIWYQTTLMHSDFPQQQRLIDMLVAQGIPHNEISYGYLMPLLHHWLELVDPFALEEKAVSELLGIFSDAVSENLVLTRLRDIIQPLDLTSGPILLEKGVLIRSINEEELWELGDIDNRLVSFYFPSTLGIMPNENWKVLDIEIQRKREPVHPPEDIQSVREAVFAALALISPGHLQVYDLGTRANYGIGATGTVRTGAPTPREIGRWGGRYVLNTELSQRLKELWPHPSRIIKAKGHYLRIPAQRLVDGGGRFREDDAIIDYAIGLEALLLKDITAELSYRFALRGATILTWNHTGKEQFFTQLQDFYDIRSKIVHGGQLDSTKLKDARVHGEKALREIWWWCFNSKEDLSRALAKVDKVIFE